MTDAERKQLTELARNYIRAQAEYRAAHDAIAKLDTQAVWAEQQVARLMRDARLSSVIVDGKMLCRCGDGVNLSDDEFAILD